MKQFSRLFAGPLGALLIAVALATLAMLVAGVSPIDGFGALLGGSLGGPHQIAETLVQTTSLLFPALGVTLAFRAGLFNIGAEGQLLLGGLFAGALGARLNLPSVVEIPILLLAGLVGGGAWGALAGWMKARLQANEIISTLMLNFVALSLANYLVSGPLRSSVAAGAELAPVRQGGILPVLLPDTRLTVALLLAIALAVLLRFVLKQTVFG
ncbi:MAG: ABC transporter permease, partial [Candidatus Eremiobacteraeota bacterium]|nr:ABC transporter permease [Candidatus Eremiobacteraeota bacterium]